MGGNHFYSNAEAYAYEILQQKLIKEAQRTAQQTVIELSALRSLFNQGQFLYCIPFGGHGLSQNIPFSPCSPCSPCSPFSNMCPMETNFVLPDTYYHPFLPSQAPPPPPPPPPPPQPQSPQNASPCSPASPHPPPHNLLHSQLHNNNNNNNKLSVIHMNLKNQPKPMAPRPSSDECNLGKEGIDVSIDLREYIPAEIQINVEEKSVEIKACHVNEEGRKTFSRRYDLPACIILDSVRCFLSHDGYLILSASWMKME